MASALDFNKKIYQDGSTIYAATATGNDTYEITLAPVPAAYINGMVINFKTDVANVGPATLNVNGLGAIAINKLNDQALINNDIEANQIVTVVYNSTGPKFQMQSQLANNPASMIVNTQSFTTPGAGTYTPTTNMKYCIIELQGAGGGSGGTTGAPGQAAIGGAGGGGGYLKILATAANIGASAALSVGAAGAAGASGVNAGGAGGNSTISINASTWTAGGGLSGTGQAASAAAQQGEGPGGPSVSTPGANATLIVAIEGCSGSYGFTQAAAGLVVRSSGGGGASFLSSKNDDGLSSPNQPGLVYGGGAPGSYNATGANSAGGAGAQGIIIITEYIFA